MLPSTLVMGMFFFAVASSMLLNMLDLVGTSLYDLAQIKKQKIWLKNPGAKQFRNKPLISIIIPTCNEDLIIERCMKSIIKSSYRKYEIIVVDNASIDGTKEVVKQFIAKHPTKKIKLVTKRKDIGRGGAINAGFKTHAKGELIMVLDGDSALEKHTLANAVRHFAIDDISALAANVRIIEQPSILSLLQQFEYLTIFRSKKLYTIANAEYVVGGSGAIYKRDILKKLKGFDESMRTEDVALSLAIASLGNKKFKLYYGSDVVVYTEPAPTYIGLFKQRYNWKLGNLQALFAHKGLFFSRNPDSSKFLSWFRLPLIIWQEVMLLLEPLLITYFIYLALVFKQPFLYGITWLAVSFLLAFAVWADDQLALRKKLRLIVYIPVMYNLLYILTVIQVLAMLKCLVNFKKITRKTVIKGSWKPSERLASKT